MWLCIQFMDSQRGNIPFPTSLACVYMCPCNQFITLQRVYLLFPTSLARVDMWLCNQFMTFQRRNLPFPTSLACVYMWPCNQFMAFPLNVYCTTVVLFQSIPSPISSFHFQGCRRRVYFSLSNFYSNPYIKKTRCLTVYLYRKLKQNCDLICNEIHGSFCIYLPPMKNFLLLPTPQKKLFYLLFKSQKLLKYSKVPFKKKMCLHFLISNQINHFLSQIIMTVLFSCKQVSLTYLLYFPVYYSTHVHRFKYFNI